MKNTKLNILLSIVISLLLINLLPTTTVFAEAGPVAVVLSSQDDPYYALAEEIAAEEGLEIFHTVDEALESDPVYLLWVIAPQRLSEQVLVDFSYKIKAAGDSLSVGIFSGETYDEARGLWVRARQHYLPVDGYTIINGSGATQKQIAQVISSVDNEEEIITPLTKENLLNALAEHKNVQIALEGTATSWFEQQAKITIHDEDIPTLDDAVILHYGCSTFQPWEENSIANACIHQGALAYMGFIYPSIAGTSFGNYNYNGLLYTWEKFPIGHLVAVQNKAVMQSYTDAAHYYLLGDPRIYRQGEMPYTIIRDEVSGSKRLLELSDVPKGLIPIYVPDGANYNFVSIAGGPSSSMHQSYFNRYVQMINIDGDKYILIENEQAYLHIELSEKVPFFRQFSNNSINFLDSIIVDGMHADIYVLFIILIAILLLVRLLRKRMNGKHLGIAALFGAMMTLVVILISLLRIPAVTISNSPVSFNFLFPLNVFVCTTYGLMLYLDAKSRKGRAGGILLTNLYSLFTLLFFGIAMLVRIIVVGNPVSVEKATYPWLFPVEKLIMGLAVYGVFYWFIEKWLDKKAFLNEGDV